MPHSECKKGVKIIIPLGANKLNNVVDPVGSRARLALVTFQTFEVIVIIGSFKWNTRCGRLAA